MHPISTDIHRSSRLTAEAEKKWLVDLMEESDDYVSPMVLKPRINARYDGKVVVANVLLGMEWMRSLFVTAHRMERRVKGIKIYEILLTEKEGGDCHLFFVGTVSSILKRLKSLDDVEK
jgi:hypothetical protein